MPQEWEEADTYGSNPELHLVSGEQNPNRRIPVVGFFFWDQEEAIAGETPRKSCCRRCQNDCGIPGREVSQGNIGYTEAGSLRDPSVGKDGWITVADFSRCEDPGAITALFYLSIHNNNKILIVAASAVDHIIAALEVGKTMEARKNATATIFSQSTLDDSKVIIGGHPRAILALVGLLGDGTTAGKRDAATTLFNLAVYNASKSSIVVARAVPLLIALLMDDKAGITDDALTLLALLLGCPEGLQEIGWSRVLVPLLVDLLRFGSLKGKENSITLLLGLCNDGGERVAGRLLMNPRSIPSLCSLAVDRSLKARRKAEDLLRLLNRYCSHSRHWIVV